MIPSNEMMTAVQLVNQLEEMCQNSVAGTSLQSRADIKKMSQYSIREVGSSFHVNTVELGKELFKCVNCGRNYLHRRNLWRHMKLECGKEPAFQCPYCPKRTKQKVHMKSHITVRHENHLSG